MGIFAFLVMGLIAGAIARKILPGRIGHGLISALICGAAGALTGSWLSSMIFHTPLGGFWEWRSWLIAIAGSVLVLLVWGLVTGRSRRAR